MVQPVGCAELFGQNGVICSLSLHRHKRVTVHSVSSNTLRDAQIWSILHLIALAASGFSCFRHENASRYSGL